MSYAVKNNQPFIDGGGGIYASPPNRPSEQRSMVASGADAGGWTIPPRAIERVKAGKQVAPTARIRKRQRVTARIVGTLPCTVSQWCGSVVWVASWFVVSITPSVAVGPKYLVVCKSALQNGAEPG